ncbi:MAG TPA: hypothetical protein VHH73_20285, partial [Verrucomicrobiae bacterium]|nr:hypothetical protein [Verrucomicrobiae bacterium]
CPSAANNNYWPEMYTNMAIVDAHRRHPYSDTLSPKRFGAVSSLDPEFFSRIDDFAEALLHGTDSGKYSPAEVAAYLEELAGDSAKALATASRRMRQGGEPAFRRAAADIAIQNGLGRFFAWKFRAAILFAIYSQTGSVPALRRAREAYGRARGFWAEMAEAARPIYREDVTFGPEDFQRGHWTARLPAIDADLADMDKLLEQNGKPAGTEEPVKILADAHRVEEALRAVMAPTPRLRDRLSHVAPRSFRRGEPLMLSVSERARQRGAEIKSVSLRYRQVNQGEIWQSCEMGAVGATAHFEATIPASYTDSPFSLQYHFALTTTNGRAALFPGFEPGFRGQPYFVVELSGRTRGRKAG